MPAPGIDPRLILGISSTATEAEAKAAYRRLAKLFHPDRNRSEGATEMMRIINLARDALRADEDRPSARRKEPASRMYRGDPCDFVMQFGKHRGKTLRDIERTNPQYLDWLADSIFDEGPDAREANLINLINTMREHHFGDHRRREQATEEV